MHVMILNVNEPLFEAPLGDDATVLRELGRNLERLTVVIATSRAREPVELGPGVRLVPAHAPDRIRGLASMVRALRSVHASHPIDLIQAQESMYTGLAALVASRLTKSRLSVCVFGTDPGDPGFRTAGRAHAVASILGRAVLRAADVVQTDSRHTEQALRARGLPARYKPVTPVNLDVFAGAYAQRSHRDEARRILFVGRLGRQKRAELLLRAVARLDNLELVIVGDGEERAHLEGLASSVGVHATFTGQVAHEALRTAYLDADLLVSTSYYEGLPRAFMEAAATGLPIVSTAVAGALEFQKLAPIWIGPPDAEGYAEVLRSALHDHERRRRCGEILHEMMLKRIEDAPPPAQQLAIWKRLAEDGAPPSLEGHVA